jgi:hypothetical protein
MLAATITFGGGILFGEPARVPSTFHTKATELIGIHLAQHQNVVPHL